MRNYPYQLNCWKTNPVSYRLCTFRFFSLFLKNSSNKTVSSNLKICIYATFYETFMWIRTTIIGSLDCLQHDPGFFRNYDMKRRYFIEPFQNVTFTTGIQTNELNTTQKRQFPLKSVNENKSAVSCEYVHIYWRKL